MFKGWIPWAHDIKIKTTQWQDLHLLQWGRLLQTVVCVSKCLLESHIQSSKFLVLLQLF